MMLRGDDIARFEVLEQIGSGGMGVVFEGRERQLGTPVAIKAVKPEFADDPAYRRRFRRESEAIKTIRHPNVLQVLAVSPDDDGQPYFVTPLIANGYTAKALLRDSRKRLDLAVGVDLVLQAADGIAQAHADGRVHRDIKPANLLLTRTIRGFHVLVADFGLVKELDDDSSSLTRIEQQLGTPGFSAPEQYDPALGAITPASDVYALGRTLGHLLTGGRPQPGQPLRLPRRDVPRRIRGVIDKATQHEPDRRYPDARAFYAALARAAEKGGLAPRGGRRRGGPAVASGADRHDRRAHLERSTASEPVPAPPAPKPPELSPRRRERSERRRKRSRAWIGAARALAVPLTLALALAAVVIAAIVRGGDDPPRQAVATLTTGPLSARYTGPWTPTRPSALASRALEAPAAVKDDATGASLAIGDIRQTVRTADPLPDALRDHLGGVSGPQEITVGGLSVLRYYGTRGGSSVDVLMASTARRWSAAICAAPATERPAATEACNAVIKTLARRGGRFTAVGPSLGLAATLTTSLQRPAALRRDLRKELSESTPLEQRETAANKVADAYARAHDAVRDAPRLLRDGAAMDRVLRALTAEAAAFERLAGAAKARSKSDYEQAQAAVGTADDELSAARKALSGKGYPTAA